MQHSYPCVASSPSAFVRQLAASYLPHGYRLYVCGHVPDRLAEHPEELDRRMIEKFEIDISKAIRSKRRSQGIASVRYIRFERFWMLISTRGRHHFFDEHRKVSSISRKPVLFHGYEIRLVQDRPRVRIERQEYRRLHGYLLGICTRGQYRGVDHMARAVRRMVNFDPYREVIAQYVRLIRHMNRRRRSQGLVAVPLDMVKLRRPKLHGPRLVCQNQTDLPVDNTPKSAPLLGILDA